jgi:mono/diheme cytochrome c family protein
MKHLRLLSLLVVFVLVLTPLAVMAQDEEEIKLEEFVSRDELLTIGYPKDWVVEEPDIEVTGLPGVGMAPSQDILDRLNSEDEDAILAEGEVAVQAILLPIDLLALMGLTPPESGEELGILAITDTLAASLMGEDTNPPAEGEEPENKAEEIDLREGVVAGYMKTVAPEVEGALFVFQANDGVLAVVFGGTYPGEFTDEFNSLVQAIAASLEYTGTGEDLMALLMGEGGGPIAEPTEAAAPTTAAALDGNALVDERCTVCHTRDRIDSERTEGLDQAQWGEIVDDMIGKGAQLNDEERAAVIEYLASTD